VKQIPKLALHSNTAGHGNSFHIDWTHFVELFLPICLQLAGLLVIHSMISPLLFTVIIAAAHCF
jgi:hypothetical protein